MVYFDRIFFINSKEFLFQLIIFQEDYRITCCIGLLKFILIKHRGEPDEDDLDVHITSSEELKKMKADAKIEENSENGLERSKSLLENVSPTTGTDPAKSSNTPNRSLANRSRKSINKSITSVPVEAVEFAIKQLRDYIDFRDNNDLDKLDQSQVSEEKWQRLYEWFYAACQ